MDNNYLTVTELNTYLRQIVDSEEMIHRICVVGEISGLSLRGPHAYFTLKDENSQLRCCTFNYAKTHVPKDGDLVLLFGSIDFYLKGGYLSFNVIRIEPYGQGLLALKLEELKKKLLSLGYFDESHKVAIPSFCDKIAVITSKDGAVLHDIVRTIRSKNYVTDIDFFDVKVQGNGSAMSIIDTLSKVDKLGYDAIIIARGGGSYEDLMGFNDEKLVYAIYDAKTPIVSAVGHETDTTLCDFASDLRVPTPTAAGELFAYDINGMIDAITNNINFAYDMLRDKYSSYSNNYKSLLSDLVNATKAKFSDSYADLRVIKNDLLHSVVAKYNATDSLVRASIKVLSAANPANILERGYAEIRDDAGNAVTSIRSLSVGDSVSIKGKDGVAKADITSISEE